MLNTKYNKMMLVELVTGKIIKKVENMSIKEMMQIEKENRGCRFMNEHNYNVYMFGLTGRLKYLN